MGAFLHRLCYIGLMLVGLVPYSTCSDTGCEDWTISGGDVCCKRCKPGNRMVKSCGSDPASLCTPCESDTFTTNPYSLSCLKCNQCFGIQFVLKPCNITSNTVCGCKAGYRCENEQCSYCVTECREGEEPTNFRSCRKCPVGTFNNKIHSTCKKWKESCPEGQIMEAIGNAFRDHECVSTNEIQETKNDLDVKPPQNTKYNDFELLDNSLSVVNKENKEKINWIPVIIAGGVALLSVFCIIASVVACVKEKQRRTTEKPKADISDQELLKESRIMIVEQEACSFHHPDQEQGSSESIHTQDSETKLIV